MAYELGDAVALSWTATASGGTIALSITLPDGTTASPSITTTGATNTATYTTAQAGRHVVAWTATGAVKDAYRDVFDVTDASDAGLVSLDDLKRHLNITTTTYDDELKAFGMVAADLVEGHCNRYWRRRTVVDTFDAGGEAVNLTKTPIISITSVVAREVAVSTQNYRVNLLTGRLRYRWGFFPGDYEDLVVTYVAGAAVVPPVVQQAALETTRHLWQTQRGAMGARSALSGDDFADRGMGMSFSLPRRVTELLTSVRVQGMA
jgi:hypothetical protein